MTKLWRATEKHWPPSTRDSVNRGLENVFHDFKKRSAVIASTGASDSNEPIDSTALEALRIKVGLMQYAKLFIAALAGQEQVDCCVPAWPPASSNPLRAVCCVRHQAGISEIDHFVWRFKLDVRRLPKDTPPIPVSRSGGVTITQGVLTEEECRQIVSILDQTAAREGHTGEGPEWNRDLSFFLGREGVLKQESAVMAKPRAIGTAHPNPAAL